MERIIEASENEGIEEALSRAEMYAYFFINKDSALKMGREMRELLKAKGIRSKNN
ncbi:MAG: hypothetical protein H0Z28_01290 [Archaeoglobus sp.]|nr:hypothetical protein [Archaeoglobus sp.]